MKITTVGIDLAKNVIVVHGVDERGKAVLKTPLKRDQVAPFFANLPACRIGMEACGSAHHWARKLESFGCNSHTDDIRWAFRGTTFSGKETSRRYSAETSFHAPSKRSLWARARKVRMA